MRETQPFFPISPAEPVAESQADAGMGRKLRRAARLWARVVAALVLLNFALAVYHLLRADDPTTFLTHQLFTPFLTLMTFAWAVPSLPNAPETPSVDFPGR